MTDDSQRPAAALLGRTITAVRRLEPGEVADLDRPERVTVLELDDGTLLVGAKDDIFWGLGWLWAREPSSKAWALVASKSKEAA